MLFPMELLTEPRGAAGPERQMTGLALEPVSKLSCGRCLLQTPELREPRVPFRVEKGKVSTQAERHEIQARVCWLLHRDL